MRFFLLLLLLTSCGGRVSPPPENKHPLETITISATDLGQAYEDNQVDADLKYKGKQLVVNGIVADVVDQNSKLWIGIIAGNIPLQCFFTDRDSVTQIAAIRKETAITVTGENLGRLPTGYIVLGNCHIN